MSTFGESAGAHTASEVAMNAADDSDPLPSRGFEYNTSTESIEEEHRQVVALSLYVDALLHSFAEPVYADGVERTSLATENAMIIRTIPMSKDGRRFAQYEFIDYTLPRSSDSNKPGFYCRRWDDDSHMVDYCFVENRYEPAESVKLHIFEHFQQYSMDDEVATSPIELPKERRFPFRGFLDRLRIARIA